MSIAEIVLAVCVVYLLAELVRTKRALKVLDWKTKDLLQKTKRGTK